MKKKLLTTENTENTEKMRLIPLCSLCSLWFILFVFSGCVPSETPEVLRQTPGAAVIVDGDRYTNDAFSVSVPAGWRVITAPAGAASAVTLAAADNCTLIHLSITPADPPTAPNCDQPTQTLTSAITLAEQTIYAAASAPVTIWAAFTDQFDQVLASLR